MDLVSVIVPVYNVEKYLNRCVDSILEQTYENLEIILVDDGSTDNSGKICDYYRKKDTRVVVIHKTNGGLSDARNSGIDIAKGDYLCFVDSDDYVDKIFIQTLYCNLHQYETSISAVNLSYFDDNNSYRNLNNVNGEPEILSESDSIRVLFTNDKYCNYAWNKLYKSELFEGIRYPVGKKMEDLGTTYLLIEKARKIVYNPKPLYYYYQRSDSILHKPDSFFFKDKYDLTYQRYLNIKKIYPMLRENYDFYVNSVFECYRYLDDQIQYEARNEMKKIWKKVKKEYKVKKRIKYLIFRLNDDLFIKVFGK